jgi:hypothetical protein
MVPSKPAAAAFILIWSLIPTLAASESTSPGSVDAETEIRDQRSQGNDTAGLGVREAAPANGDGQTPESANPSGSVDRRDEAPSLGLCDGS